MENVLPFRRPDIRIQSDSGDEQPATPATRRQPLLSDGKVAHANAERTLMELEQTIAAFVKESDGSSKLIPRFRQALGDLRTNLEKLKP